MNVDASAIDALFAEWDTSHTPGCVLGVIQDGAFVYQRAYGMADLERNVPLSIDALFDLGSIGKQFVATLVALLAEDQLLSLDDSVHRYIPELPDYGAPITIRHLIHHTSGVRDYLSLMLLTNRPFENQYPEEELLDLLLRQTALNYPTGEEYLYSNGGYFLLGIIAQRVTGQRLPDLLQQWILAPLGMQHTQGNDNLRRIAPGRALAYTQDEQGAFATDLSYLGGFGDGPLLSNLADLLLWDQNFYQNRLGKADPALINLLETPGRLNNGESTKYGFGLQVDVYRGLPAIGHSGGWAGYVSYMLRFPQQRFTVICLANLNTIDPAHLALQVADLFLAEHFEDVAAEATEQSSERIAIVPEQVLGHYRSRNLGNVAAISHHEQQLLLTLFGRKFPLRLLDTGILRSTSGVYQVEISQQAADLLLIDAGGMLDLYDRLEPVETTGEQLASYAASYYANELDICYKFFVEGDLLMFKPGFAPAQPLDAISRDLFSYNRMSFEFVRDANNLPSSVLLSVGRLKNIRFTRRND